MKRKRVIIAIYLVAMLLYLLATVLKISFGGHVVGSENHIVTEIESVNAKFPIGEKEIAFLEALFEDRELKEIKEANIFVGNFGVYEFKVTESSERQLIFSEDLYELAKQEVGISVFYNEKKAVIAGSDMMLGENENLISEMLLREYFDMEAEELPTTVVQVQMDSNVDLNTLEEKLLKRGLHFKDYSRNKYNMLTSSGI